MVNDQETLWLTEAAIASLSYTKLIIIDNGSEYGAGKLKELASVYIRNDVNRGYAKAVNQGIEIAGSEIVVIANNDIIVSPNYDKVAEEILTDRKVGSVHFRMLPYSDSFVTGDDTWKEGKERWCTSSFFVVRRIQQYDENFFNSYDDYDFWYRLRQQGYSTAYTNKACYKHKDSYTQQQIPNRGIYDQRNREYYKQKHGEYPDEQFARMYPDQMKLPWKPMP